VRGLDFRLARAAFRDFARTWPQLLLLSLAARIAVAVILVPGLGLALRMALWTRGRSALSDEEILFFFLSPVGIVTLVLVGGASVGAALVEQAGLMTIARGAAADRRVTWYAALRHVVEKLREILALGSLLLVRVLTLGAPILGLIGAVYWTFLRQHDINYYLTDRPPEFLLAGGMAGVLVVGFAVLLMNRVLGWMYALPKLLFEDRRPRAALRESTSESRGHRRTILGWITIWAGAGWLSSAGLTWLIAVLGRVVVPQASQSVRLLAIIIGSVGLLSIVVNLLLSFMSAALFALLIVRLYREHSSGAGDPPFLIHGAESLGATPAVRVTRKGVLWGAGGAMAAALLVAMALIGRLPTEDRTIVIAHRGAALHAPENTMASIRRAIEDGADLVEIDVQETADGEVVVFHDSDFMKTAASGLKLWETKREDLEEIDVGSWFDPAFAGERVPTLFEVLLEARGHVGVDIELKYYGHDQDLERKVIDIVERTDMVRDVVVMSLKYDKVLKIRSMRPDWTYGLLTTANLGDAARFDVDFLAVNLKAATRRFVRRAHTGGREVYVWTVNDPFSMSALMSRGVDGIITDDPRMARRVLEVRAGLSPAERLLVGIGTELGVFVMPREWAAEEDA